MSREQIEEMAKDLYGYSIDTEEDCDFVAKLLYAKGYRKQSENSVAFPCKVGDTVFMIDDYDCEPYVIGVKVEYLKTDKFGEWVGLRYPLGIKYSPQKPIEDIGKIIFLTENDAENALAKMKGGAE